MVIGCGGPGSLGHEAIDWHKLFLTIQVGPVLWRKLKTQTSDCYSTIYVSDPRLNFSNNGKKRRVGANHLGACSLIGWG